MNAGLYALLTSIPIALIGGIAIAVAKGAFLNAWRGGGMSGRGKLAALLVAASSFGFFIFIWAAMRPGVFPQTAPAVALIKPAPSNIDWDVECMQLSRPYNLPEEVKQSACANRLATKQAPGPSAGERLAAIRQDCQVGLNNGRKAPTVDEFIAHARATKMTPYQANLLVSMFDENMRQCMEVALYRDPEAAAVYANVHRALSP
jgi:hypothetical protein